MGTAARLRFGVYEADLPARRLYRDEVEVHLPAKPFRLLEVLLGKAGEMVSRDDLVRALWPDTYVEFDLGLNSVMRQLRRALKDRFESPLYVETIGRAGYRFIHAVEAVEADSSKEAKRYAMGVTGAIPATAPPVGVPGEPVAGLGWKPAASSD